MEHWRHLVDNIPFIGLMATDQRNRPYVTRLLEQATPGILVGLMVAALGVWRSDAVQDKDIANINSRVERTEKQIESMRVEIQIGFEKIGDRIDYSLPYKPLRNYRDKK